MTVFAVPYPGVVVLRVRAEGAGAVGDMTVEVRPGETAFGRTYAEWAATKDGVYEVPDATRLRGRP